MLDLTEDTGNGVFFISYLDMALKCCAMFNGF